MTQHAVRRIAFDTLRQKADWIDSSASLDALSRPVRDLAQRFRRQIARAVGAVHGPRFDAELAKVLHAFVRDSIAYRPDLVPMHDATGHHWMKRAEALEDSEVILRRGFDDCDGKSRLFVALARAAGLQARIRPIFNARREFVHVQAEVRWPGSERNPLADKQGWLLAEMILRGCGLGCDPDSLPRGPDGHRALAGPS